MRWHLLDLAPAAVVGVFALASPLACGPSGGGGGGGSAGDAGPDASGGSGGSAGAAGASGAAGQGGAPEDASPDGTSGTGGFSGAGGAAGSGGTTDGGPLDATPDAVSLTCGDGIRGLDEECDDGNSLDDDACTSACVVTDYLVGQAQLAEGGVPPPGRYLGEGRHPVAAGTDGYAIAFVEAEQVPPRVSLQAFDPQGVRIGDALNITPGGPALLWSNPVVAALPAGRYAVAWNDFSGDGDEVGVALRLVDPSGAPPNGAPQYANTTTAFSQLNPDVLRVGGDVVIAWEDDSAVGTGPDLRFRVVPTSLNLSGTSEQTLAATSAAETAVCLAAFSGSWAAAWRQSAAGGTEAVAAKAGALAWSVGPHLPGPASDKPALVELDSTTLLLVYTESIDSADAGVANGSRLRGALLRTGQPGATASFVLEPASPPSSQSQPVATVVGGRTFIAWRSASTAGDPTAEQLWLQEATWDGATLSLATPLALPRWPAHGQDDQRFPALASSPLAPQGALVAAWDDYGRVLGGIEGAPDVLSELIPVPILRTAAQDGGS
ncbi:MAG: hypothetical protein KC776_34895 [Myxococcales bacterium]|nr:hypothetical protein [Myxococcales bacterium]MCB9576582.1 hypothetical protein [Polyangiaceae bacterium]MCB9609752.1 hypothetical protein [Polyangiaceae bacterium]